MWWEGVYSNDKSSTCTTVFVLGASNSWVWLGPGLEWEGRELVGRRVGREGAGGEESGKGGGWWGGEWEGKAGGEESGKGGLVGRRSGKGGADTWQYNVATHSWQGLEKLWPTAHY